MLVFTSYSKHTYFIIPVSYAKKKNANKSIFKLIEIANENLLYILVSFPFSDHFKMQGQRGQ